MTLMMPLLIVETHCVLFHLYDCVRSLWEYRSGLFEHVCVFLHNHDGNGGALFAIGVDVVWSHFMRVPGSMWRVPCVMA